MKARVIIKLLKEMATFFVGAIVVSFVVELIYWAGVLSAHWLSLGAYEHWYVRYPLLSTLGTITCFMVVCGSIGAVCLGKEIFEIGIEIMKRVYKLGSIVLGRSIHNTPAPK